MGGFIWLADSSGNFLSDDVRDAGILHIASHGYFANTDPDNVGFVLSGGEQAEGAFVTLTELGAYQFGNRLVVVSGCETAMGAEAGGEGRLSVARAFLGQGAKHVVATLWPVDDRATAVFMDHFYTYLEDANEIDGALQYAQQMMQRDRNFKDPFFWAGYVLHSVTLDQRISL